MRWQVAQAQEAIDALFLANNQAEAVQLNRL
jgi:hypothetical protein